MHRKEIVESIKCVTTKQLLVGHENQFLYDISNLSFSNQRKKTFKSLLL